MGKVVERSVVVWKVGGRRDDMTVMANVVDAPRLGIERAICGPIACEGLYKLGGVSIDSPGTGG